MSIPSLESERESASPAIALLACSVFEQEIRQVTHGLGNIVEARFFEMGLHDRPDMLRSILQENMDAVDVRPDIDAVVLAYGLCGRGTAGLRPLRHKLVIPRAHDCITLFMGSKEAYAEHQHLCPTCFYYTPGWNRDRRVPGRERLETMRRELAGTFEPDDVEFLVESERDQWAMHDTVTYLHLDTGDAGAEAEYARKCADWLGWKFELKRGDPALLRDLILGNWDAGRFQIIEPGMQLGHAPDESILRAEPARTLPPVP
jgi:hypothetical protein